MPTQTQTVTIAQALGSTATGLAVLDTAANIAAALPNSSLTARVASFTVTATATVPAIMTVPQLLLLSPLGATLHAPAGALELNSAATVTAAQLTAMQAVPGFTLGSGASITLSDTTANIVALLAAHPAYFAQLATITMHLDGTSIGAYPATQLEGLSQHGKVLNIVPTGSYTTLNVAATAHDLGSNGTALAALATHYPVSFTLTNEGATIIAADAIGLTMLPGFNIAAHNLIVSATAANLDAHASQIFGHGFTEIMVLSGNFSGTAAQLLDFTLQFASGALATLSASATLTGAASATLLGLPGVSLASGVTLAVADTAANLVATDAAWMHVASSATVTANATINSATAASLAQLAGVLGTGFSLGGHSLTIADTLANLEALSAPAIGLASATVLTANATATVAQLTQAVALPAFALGGYTITVLDTAANLLGMSAGAKADGAIFELSADAIVSRAGFNTLHALPQFNTEGHALIVLDTAANLALFTGNLAPATGFELSASATVSAAQIDAVAALPAFSLNGFMLAVSDTAVNLLSLTPRAQALASSVTLTSDATVNAAQAESLASGPGFSVGGHHLTITDTAANLLSLPQSLQLAATALTLSSNQTATAAMLGQLAALGIKFSANGHALSEADTAANVAGSAASLSALHITATVSDTAANIGAQESNLAALGSALATVHTTDTAAVSAATAAGISGLAAKLSGPALAVADSAAGVDAAIAALRTLGAHVAVTVTDSAANVAPVSLDLASLQGALSVVLTDSQPVSAAIAAGIAPLASNLAAGTSLPVHDSAANIAAHEPALAALGGDLGQITLTDGTTQNAATAAALAPLASHLAAGLQLTVVDTGAQMTASESGLLQLAQAGALAQVRVPNTTVADATANAAALNALPSLVTINDSAADVQAGLPALAQLTGLGTIVLTDIGIPTLTLSVATLSAGAGALAQISTPFSLDVADTAADIQADLASTHSVLAAQLGGISQITVSDGHPVVLTQAQILKPGIDDSVTSVLGRLTGTVDVTGADLAHLAQLNALIHAPAQIAVADTAADIAADLANGLGSALILDGAKITAIAVTDGQPLVLTAAQALGLGVDDSAHAVLAKLSGAPLWVTNATVAELPALHMLYVQPASISMADSGANISADLASGNSLLLQNAAVINTIAVQDHAAITLTVQQAEAAGIDDGAGSVLAKISGAALDVTGAATSDLTTVLGLPVAPASVAIADTAAHVLSSLNTIISDIGKIGAINVTSGTLTLSAAEAEAAHVDDGAGSVIGLVSGHAFNVANATVANLPGLWALQVAPALVSIADSSANIAADLASGMSLLAAHPTWISSITVNHGVLALTDAQADAILGTQLPRAMLNKLVAATAITVSGVPVADIANLAGAGLENLRLAVTDTPSAIAADLAAGPLSVLMAHTANLSGVTLSADGTVGAAALAGMSNLPGFARNGHALTVQDAAAAILSLGAAPLALATAVSVHDTDADVGAALDALQSMFHGALSITLTNAAPVIAVSLAQYTADQPTIDALTNPGVVNVQASAAAAPTAIAALAADAAVGQVTVTDSAADVISNLASLQALGGKLAVVLTDTTLAAADVIPLLAIANLSASNIPIVDSGAAIAALAESGNAAAIAYLTTNGSALSANSMVGAIDAAALEGLSHFSLAGHTLQVWDTASHLTSPAYASALNNADVSGVYLKAPGGTAVVSAATAAALFNIPGFSTHNPDGSANVLAVSDSAAHIDAALASLGGVGSIVVNSSAEITEQTLSDLRSVGAQTAPGVSLTVSDTPAHIADAQAHPVPPGQIQPVAYTLSASGSVTEQEAVALGNLGNFSAAGHTIVLQGGSAGITVSVADADVLGNLDGALDLSQTALRVQGTAAQLAALSPAALSVVTTALADSSAVVLALPANSPLLHGSVEITDAYESVNLTAAQAQSLLALSTSASHLAIDNANYVVDTAAHLQALEASSAWTGNASLQPKFIVGVVDTVANLISPANAGFLAGVAFSQLANVPVTLDAADAASLAAKAASIHFNNYPDITVADTAAHLLAAGASGLSLAATVTLSGPNTVDAADATQLLQIPHLQINTPLSIIDSSANLLDSGLAAALTGRADLSHVSVQLAGPETLDADTAETLVQVPGFNDAPGDLTIADEVPYLLDAGNLSAEQIASVVTLDGDACVSANTVLRLSEVPHFTPGSSHLVLANNDYADAPTLKAIADMGSAFSPNLHTITMTQDVSGLTPTEAAALQHDNIVANGHVITVSPTNATVTDIQGVLSVSATGVAGGTVSIYNDQGINIANAVQLAAGFTMSVADSGHNYSAMETFIGGSVAPLVVLDAALLESSVTAAHGSFASSGAIAVDHGKFVDLYLAGTVPTGLTHAALVYDPTSHQVSLDVPGSQPVTLVTLGGSTHPLSLSVAEILIKHAG